MSLPQFFVIVCCSLLLPVSSLAATPEPVTRDVAELISQNGLSQTPSELMAIEADETGKNHAFLFKDAKTDEAIVYKNSSLIYRGESNWNCFRPGSLFKMTDDGHVLYSPDCWTLRVDKELVQKSGLGSIAQGAGFAYQDGALTFIDGAKIRRYIPATKKTKTLYSLPRNESASVILAVRLSGSHVAYSVQGTTSAAIYVDGKKVSSNLTNPANFLLTADGTVYYFVQGGKNYTIFKDKKPYFTKAGEGGFIQSDEDGNIWHVSFVLDPAGKKAPVISLYKNTVKKNLIKVSLTDAEQFMALQEGHVALRGQTSTGDFKLVLNGSFVGQGFAFQPDLPKDFHGIFFGDDGSAYMRNYDATLKTWLAYRDGEPFLTSKVTNVLLVHALSDGTIEVYGTAK